MKKTIEKLASRSKDTDFKFDDNISFLIILELLFDKAFQLFRGKLFCLRGKYTKGLFLGRSVKLRAIKKIQFGRWVSIGDYSYISGLGKGNLSFGHGVSIGSHSRVFISVNYRNLGEYLIIGNNVGIGDYSCVAGSGGVEIGDGTITGPYFSVHPEEHVFEDTDSEIRTQGTMRSPIKIGKDCWIGAKVTVLSGVSIGNGCVVGAGSVVTKDLPDGAVAVGIPAKVIKYRS